MNTTLTNSPMDVLVFAQIQRLRSVESQLLQDVSRLASDDKLAEMCVWSSISEVRDRTQRLDRMLDAMAGIA